MWCSAVLVLCWMAWSQVIAVPEAELTCEPQHSLSAKSTSLLQIAPTKPRMETSSALYNFAQFDPAAILQYDAAQIAERLTKGSTSQRELQELQYLSTMSSQGNGSILRSFVVPTSTANANMSSQGSGSTALQAQAIAQAQATARAQAWRNGSIWDWLQSNASTASSSAVPVASPIDFAYCWSGEAAQMTAANARSIEYIEGHNGGSGYNEMELSLRSLLKFAPWLHKVYLLVDGPAKPPSSAAGDERVVMVDRCTLFPNKSDCPTNNTAACQSVLHKVPHLQEKFVYMEDDWILVNPVAPEDFFAADDGKPWLAIDVQEPWVQDIYNQNVDYSPRRDGPDMPPAKVPPSIFPKMMVHAPIPMLLSFSKQFESEFTDWFAFVRSHRNRFSCCDAQVHGNGVDELFHVIYPAMLYKTGIGKPNSNSHSWGRVVLDTQTCECTDPYCIKNLFNQKNVKCLALQSCTDPVAFRTAYGIVLQLTGITTI